MESLGVNTALDDLKIAAVKVENIKEDFADEVREVILKLASSFEEKHNMSIKTFKIDHISNKSFYIDIKLGYRVEV